MKPRLLHIDASPRDTRSRSRSVAGAFLAELGDSVDVELLDLWAMALPELGGGMIEGRYALIMGGEVEPDVRSAWADVERHARHFLSFDAYLVSTPMWNFGVPYRLKHFIDVVTQPRMAFTNDADGNVVGHAAGKHAVVIVASAMDIQPDGALAALDFQLRYLETWLRFIGVNTIDTLRVAPTFGPPDQVHAAMERGVMMAAELARSFGHRRG